MKFKDFVIFLNIMGGLQWKLLLTWKNYVKNIVLT